MVKLSDLASGKRREVIDQRAHIGGVMCLAFSPDGCVVASGGGTDGIRLWDARTGRIRATFRQPIGDQDPADTSRT
jgi:WD40 repeat protein